MRVRDRVVGLRRVRAGDLLPHPKNWRTHPDQQREAMRAVLDEVGYAGALLAFETPEGLMLIDGHLRAETTPDHEVPVLVLDLTPTEAEKMLAVVDPISMLAQRDGGMLAALLKGLDATNDLLLQKVWPNDMMDLLRGATSGPPVPETEPVGRQKKVTFTRDEWKVVSAAIKAYRASRDLDTCTDAQCLTAICAEHS